MTEEMICAYCGKEIEIFEKYFKHDKTGIIVHKKCFKKFLKRENKNA